ncbi:MAG: hypothetical protein ACK2U1_05060 [Anaerolineales bacterium]|jgi:5-formyltetrahydrofolate cyclo-ligase
MLEKTYARGTLLWVDDSLRDRPFPENPWTSLFGSYSDRVFRLMDLSLEVAVSYNEALQILDSFESHKEVGTFIYCVVDLTLPTIRDSMPALRCGVALAKELRSRDLPFAFLSANAGGATVLAHENLSAVPYYVKDQHETSIWRFPDDLTLKVASEFRRHISWVSISEVVKMMRESSDIYVRYRVEEDTFQYFPFFGPYREFVERCEYRTMSDLPRASAVRATRSHCDEFVQQAIAILLYPTLLRRPEKIRVSYGHGNNQKYIDQLNRSDYQDDINTVSIIRIDPLNTEIDDLEQLLVLARRLAGRTIFVMPNDESIDEFTEYLRKNQINTIEELPQTRLGDSFQREEMLRQGCTIAFHQWARGYDSDHPVLIREDSLNYPEFLINPIDWTVLLENNDIAEALSDPYEIVKEFSDSLRNIGSEQEKELISALELGKPVEYAHLLKVGRSTLMKSEYGDSLLRWIEKTLDTWLKTSRQSPYGLIERMLYPKMRNNIRELDSSEDAIDQAAWQDACYEILVGIINEYEKNYEPSRMPTEREILIQPVFQFVKALGGLKFLSGDLEDVNWRQLESIRWPHRHYPMPSAILRRVREAKRYLWIQPEGLDLAMNLPSGRLRYRMLSTIVDEYWSTLNWAQQIAPNLPEGWRQAVSYLVEIITNNRIEEAWMGEQLKVWYQLLALLRNGLPVMFITDQLVQGKPIKDGDKSIKYFLSSLNSFGPLLARLRQTRARRVDGYLVAEFNNTMTASDIDWLHHINGFFEHVPSDTGEPESNNIHLTELTSALIILAHDLSQTNEGGFENCLSNNSFVPFSKYLANPELNMTDNNGWYIEQLAKIFPDYSQYGEIPSLLGTKIDHLWRMMDLLLHLENITHRYRYYDGYHLLSSLRDLRVHNKETMPEVPVAAIETIMDLFVASLEGIIAQLAWCVAQTGNKDLAEAIAPRTIRVQPPESYKLASQRTLNSIMRVERNGQWEFYTLGIPGEGSVAIPSYHINDTVKTLQTA